MTVKQAAEQLGVSQATVYLLCAKQKLKHMRIGCGRGVIRIDEQDLARFIDGCKVRVAEPSRKELLESN